MRGREGGGKEGGKEKGGATPDVITQSTSRVLYRSL